MRPPGHLPRSKKTVQTPSGLGLGPANSLAGERNENVSQSSEAKGRCQERHVLSFFRKRRLAETDMGGVPRSPAVLPGSPLRQKKRSAEPRPLPQPPPRGVQNSTWPTLPCGSAVHALPLHFMGSKDP